MFGVKRNRKLAVLLSLALVVELFAISPNTASANVSKEPAETVSTGFIEDSQEAPLALRLEDSFWGTTRYDAPSDVLDEPLVLHEGREVLEPHHLDVIPARQEIPFGKRQEQRQEKRKGRQHQEGDQGGHDERPAHGGLVPLQP